MGINIGGLKINDPFKVGVSFAKPLGQYTPKGTLMEPFQQFQDDLSFKGPMAKLFSPYYDGKLNLSHINDTKEFFSNPKDFVSQTAYGDDRENRNRRAIAIMAMIAGAGAATGAVGAGGTEAAGGGATLAPEAAPITDPAILADIEAFNASSAPIASEAGTTSLVPEAGVELSGGMTPVGETFAGGGTELAGGMTPVGSTFTDMGTSSLLDSIMGYGSGAWNWLGTGQNLMMPLMGLNAYTQYRGAEEGRQAYNDQQNYDRDLIERRKRAVESILNTSPQRGVNRNTFLARN